MLGICGSLAISCRVMVTLVFVHHPPVIAAVGIPMALSPGKAVVNRKKKVFFFPVMFGLKMFKVYNPDLQ